MSEDVLEKSVLDEICTLLDSIAEADTKGDADKSISLARFQISNIQSALSGYAAEKLAYAFNAAKEASGRVSDKGRKIEIYQTEKYKFTRCIDTV